MGFAEQYLRAAEEKEKQQATMPAICRACGSKVGVRLYAEDINDTWAVFIPAYEKDYRCFLCPDCVLVMKPSVMSLIEKGKLQGLSQQPITDVHGKYLPGITAKLLSLKPHYFPPDFLGDLGVLASVERITRLVDCYVLDLIPAPDQHFWLDRQLHLHGYVMTSFSFSYPLPQLSIPCRVKFTSRYDQFDRKRVAIWRR